MASEPISVSVPSNQVEHSSQSSSKEDMQPLDQEDPYSLNAPSVALLGVTIAIAAIGIPIAAVLTARPSPPDSSMPATLESNGSKTSLPISIARFSKPNS